MKNILVLLLLALLLYVSIALSKATSERDHTQQALRNSIFDVIMHEEAGSNDQTKLDILYSQLDELEK